MNTYSALDHAIALMQRESITPEDGGCQDYIETILQPLGFKRQQINVAGVTNSIYYRVGEREGLLAFAGHTDVVPTGPIDRWLHPPFAAVVERDVLHGRGAQDMKGGLACWMAAIQQLCASEEPLPGLQFLITSDEEGDSTDGSIRIVEALQETKQLPDGVVVGEPSSSVSVGDTIRRGRRGVVQVTAVFEGKQGHSAYPQDAVNAMHQAIPALHRILDIDWGVATEDFPVTTCQITNVQAGTGAMNVIPGNCMVSIDIRYNPEIGYETIRDHMMEACLESGAILDISHQAEAFMTPDGSFLDLVCRSIRRVTDLATKRDTGGGTSDGRFFASAGVPVVELGLTNSTIHQVNEQVALEELDTLTAIYRDIIRNFMPS
ncbi:MAG: succinyl-diaminopimelate desuccinylase [Mariprofundaceae bacterium]